jgi:hypothetical protein
MRPLIAVKLHTIRKVCQHIGYRWFSSIIGRSRAKLQYFWKLSVIGVMVRG